MQIGAKLLGSGFEGVEKIDSIDDMQDEIDIFVFPDIYFTPMANRLKSEGKKVWGSGDMEMVERDRDYFMELVKEAGLPFPPTKLFDDIDKLFNYLDGVDEKVFIKLSEYRGLAETWKWIDSRFNQSLRNKIEGRLGPLKNKVKYQVQSNIDTVIEWGKDRFMIGSKYPEQCHFGFEQK